MTIQDTLTFSVEDIKKLSVAQIKELPSILDVLEYIAQIENAESIKMTGSLDNWMRMNKDGYFQPVTDKPWADNIKLMPLSQTPFLYMRGQNSYYENSRPSLYRYQSKIPIDEYELICKVKSAEFILVCFTHPVFKELNPNCKVVDLALAQHYGFPTECMDITNNKWVAAFFATTILKNGKYMPVRTGYGNGYGVLYFSKPDMLSLEHELFPKLLIVGFQYFAKPSSQYSWVYKMDRNDNFDNISAFNRIIFRHDTAASNIVFNYSYRQNRYFPSDKLSDIANEIRTPGYKISNNAISLCKTFGIDKSEDEIKFILNKHGVELSGLDTPTAHFTQEQLEKDWTVWCEFGRENLTRHLECPPMIASL